jgi:CelD/BcsL family acetyltransferase involved in cellulose biosynthesis
VISSLKIDGRIAAVHFGMMSPRAMHYWFPAYDPAFSKAAPGNALLEHLLTALGEQDVSEVHLGPGNYRYKAALGSWQIPLAQGFVALDGLAAALRRAAYALEAGAAKLPIGRMAHWPGKALRRIDRFGAFNAA